MNIAKIDYNPDTDSLEVFLSGCRIRCKGCHNEGLWSFDRGQEWRSMQGLLAQPNVHRVMVMGGEPLDQDMGQLCAMLEYLQEHYSEVWVFTGHDYVHPAVVDMVDYMKCGHYIEGSTPESWTHPSGFIITLASSNQFIIKGDRARAD